MININDSHINPELTFKRLVYLHMQQLTNFPYIEKDFDALTDYELLCLVVKYLNDVITNSNDQNDSITNLYNAFLALQDYMNNSVQELEDSWNDKTTELEEDWQEKTTEIETAFTDLQTWIDNYFDNLDVQDEINNKLDQMLEDGVLEQIIEQFIQSTALWCFDTVADMKLSSNLINGSYAKTLGYYSKNDGGMSTYKIRNKTNNDTIDEMFLISINETLLAELITNDFINVLQLGIKNDNSDTQDKLTYLFSNISNKKIYFPSGTYYIDETLYIPTNCEIVGDGSSTIIKYNGNDNIYMFDILAGNIKCSIHDLSLDGNLLANGLWDCDKTNSLSSVYGLRSKIYNLWIDNVFIGLKLSAMGSEIYNIACSGSIQRDNENSIGMIIDGTDNFINSCRFSNFGIGSLITGSNNRLVTVKSAYNGIGYKINQGNYGYYNIDAQENFKDNILINNCLESLLFINSQLAGISDSYKTGDNLVYSLLKITNSKHLNIIGTLAGRYRIADNYANEKYALYVDNESSNIIGSFSYYCFTNATILKLDFPKFYLKDNNTNNIYINYNKIQTNNYSNATITDVTIPSSCDSVTYSDNVITSTVKETTDINNKIIGALFLPANINDECFILLESEKFKFTNDSNALVIQLRNTTLGKNLNYEIPCYTYIDEKGNSNLRCNFKGLTAILAEHQEEINDELDGTVDRVRLSYSGFVNQRNNIDVTCKILSI